LITNRDLGSDGHFGTGDDTEIGGMATWGVVKAQARDVLGINLTDADVFNVPLLLTDAYGNFIPGEHGFPQVVMQTAGADGIFGNGDDGTTFVEGNPAAPIDLTHAVRTGHQFLIDIAHSADPTGATGADADTIAGNDVPVNPLTGQNIVYDNELLDAHYIAGDGRANENIGLTAVHSIFHAEHNRLVEQTKMELITDAISTGDVTFLNEWLLSPTTLGAIDPAHPDNLVWNGERLFQAGRFGTEMEYQHLVFEEFARTVEPAVDEFLAPMGYDTTINPAIVAEFAHTVYRFGHSMLTETVDRFDPNFNFVADPNSPDAQLGLIAAFLNPLEFVASGPTPEQAVSAIVRGVTRTVGNEIDEFITEALRNNLLGTPLDLAVLNLARGRDTGIPSLNEARREFYAMTSNNDVGDSVMKPYGSWVDFMQHLKHPESLINFIAAYGTHDGLTAADVDTLVEKRAVAAALVLGGTAVINEGTAQERTFTASESDRLDFLNSTGSPSRNGGRRSRCQRHHRDRRRCDRLLGRRPRRTPDAIRRTARIDVHVRIRESARKPAERRPLLLFVAHGRPELRDRAREQHLLAARHGQYRCDASAVGDFLGADVDARGRSIRPVHRARRRWPCRSDAGRRSHRRYHDQWRGFRGRGRSRQSRDSWRRR
jgi:hypothetical protein